MRIACPLCGERDSSEFAYLGDAGLARPKGGGPEDAMVEYVYLRDNPHGPHREWWHHVFGCRSWIVVERNTRTHEIAAVAPARDAGRT